MSDQGMTAGQSAQASAGLPGAAPEENSGPDPVTHYSYLGLAAVLYGTLAGWSVYHVNALASRLEVANKSLPALSQPLFSIVSRMGSLLFLPLGGLILLEIVLPRKLTRVWLVATLLLLVVGVYVAVALWLAARGQATP